MTIKEFKQHQQKTIDAIYDGYGKATILEKVKQIQPPRPTCSTCNYFITDKDVSKFKNGCSKLVWRVEFEPTIFGCSGHADYEVTDE